MSMSTEVKKGKLFIQQVVAKLKGDNNEELAAKIARKAVSAVDAQLAALRAKEVDLEGSLEDANEALNDAKFPITMITDNYAYIRNIQRAQEARDAAQTNLDDVKESIKYFETLMKEF